MSQKILLVESQSDKEFFELFCRYHQFIIKVDDIDTLMINISNPNDFGENYTTKSGVLNILTTLLPQVKNGRISHLGIIVDADFVQDGQGYNKTYQTFTQKMQEFGYIFDEPKPLISKNAYIGLWIMPNNQEEGALEHWIKANIHENQHPLYAYAEQTVDNIPNPKLFKPSRQLKAEIATWLAWQQNPSSGVANLFDKNNKQVLNNQSVAYQGLLQWFKDVFEVE